MIINESTLGAIFAAFNTLYQEAFTAYKPTWPSVAMEVPSTTEEENYEWLGGFPQMREWLGERQYKNLKAYRYPILNKDWESTIPVKRTKIEDDKIGLFKPMFSEMGRSAASQPDEMVFPLLTDGFEKLCYDKKPFFSDEHKIGKNTVSNMDVPESNPKSPWFLLDTTRAVKPLVFQNRKAPEFVAKTDPKDDHVFKNNEYLFGADARNNAGYGIWQLAFGSKQALSDITYSAARAAMGAFTNDQGVKMGIRPNLLVVGPSNEAIGRVICYAEHLASGATNPWKGTAELLVSPYLD